MRSHSYLYSHASRPWVLIHKPKSTVCHEFLKIKPHREILATTTHQITRYPVRRRIKWGAWKMTLRPVNTSLGNNGQLQSWQSGLLRMSAPIVCSSLWMVQNEEIMFHVNQHHILVQPRAFSLEHGSPGEVLSVSGHPISHMTQFVSVSCFANPLTLPGKISYLLSSLASTRIPARFPPAPLNPF
jgi:hypothetical protein